jgi:hypothetical protein
MIFFLRVNGTCTADTTVLFGGQRKEKLDRRFGVWGLGYAGVLAF